MVETRIKHTYILVVDKMSQLAASINLARQIELNVETAVFHGAGRRATGLNQQELTVLERRDDTLEYRKTVLS